MSGGLPAGRPGRLFQSALGSLLIAMVLLNVANAAGRYLLGQSIAGADEILVYGMVVLVSLGTVLVTLRGEHLQFDLLSQKLPPRLRLLHLALLNLLVAALCGWLATQSWTAVEKLHRLGQTSMAAGIPTWIVHAALFFGLVATALAAFGAASVQLTAAFLGRDRPNPDRPAR